MKKKSGDRSYLVGPIMRALKLLEAIGEKGHDVTLTEVASIVGLPKTTAFRYLQTLAAAGFLRHDAANDRYGIGPRVRMFAQADKSLHRIRMLALPAMQHLRQTFNETINLAVTSGFHVVYVEMLEAYRPLRMQARLGERHPIHSTALGKAILAFLPDAERETILKGPIPELTSRTVRSVSTLRRQLREVQRNGYARELGETEEGLACIGVPILDEGAYPLAAVSLSAPEKRMQAIEGRAIALLKQAAASISTQISS